MISVASLLTLYFIPTLLLATLLKESFKWLKQSGLRFNFRLADLLGFMFAMTPAVWLTSRYLRWKSGMGPLGNDEILALELILPAIWMGTLFGSILGRVYHQIEYQFKTPDLDFSFVWVLVGAFLGILTLGSLVVLGFSLMSLIID